MSVVFALLKHRRICDRVDRLTGSAAYALVDAARLRCQRLHDQAREGGWRASLTLVHRELVITGYLTSSRLAPERRGEQLAETHQHAERSVPDELENIPACEQLKAGHKHLDPALALLERPARGSRAAGPAAIFSATRQPNHKKVSDDRHHRWTFRRHTRELTEGSHSRTLRRHA